MLTRNATSLKHSRRKIETCTSRPKRHVRTPAGGVTTDDLLYYLARYAGGC